MLVEEYLKVEINNQYEYKTSIKTKSLPSNPKYTKELRVFLRLVVWNSGVKKIKGFEKSLKYMWKQLE